MRCGLGLIGVTRLAVAAASRRPIDPVTLAIVAAIPIEYDEIAKIDCLARNDLRACEDLINDFVPEVLGYDPGSKPDEEVLEDVETLRERYRGAHVRLALTDASFRGRFARDVFIVPFHARHVTFDVPLTAELDDEVKSVSRFSAELAEIRRHQEIVDGFRFWPRLFACAENPANLVSDILRHIARAPGLQATCRDPIFTARLAEAPATPAVAQLSAVCEDPFDFEAANAAFGVAVTREAVRSVFWQAVAVVDPRWDTVLNAARATPAEFNPAIKADCLQNQLRGDFCGRFVANFIRYMGYTLTSGDDKIAVALLDRFTAAMTNSDPAVTRDLLGRLTGAERRTIRRAYSSTGFDLSVKQTSWTLLERRSPGETAHLKGFERYFDLTRFSDVASIHKRRFWVEYFAAQVRSHKLVTNFARVARDLRTRRKIAAVGAHSKGRARDIKELAETPGERTVEQLEALFRAEEWSHLLTTLRFHPARIFFVMKQFIEHAVQYRYVRDKPAAQTCSICLAADVPAPTAKTPCGHEFHPACLFRWLETAHTCPYCRAELPDK
jgi:Ring finger domain